MDADRLVADACTAPRAARRRRRSAVTVVVVLGVLAAGVLSTAGGAAAQEEKDPVAVYTELLSGVAVEDAQMAYALSWEAAGVQENGLATLAAVNESRAAFIAAVEEQQRLEAIARFVRSRGTTGGGHGSRCGGDFACFQQCTLEIESHGNYGAVSPGGTYRGAWQFDRSTWDSNAAASGRPDLVGVDPATAAPGDQDAIAHDLYQRRGNQPWGGRC
jgi:hypothetical protein